MLIYGILQAGTADVGNLGQPRLSEDSHVPVWNLEECHNLRDRSLKNKHPTSSIDFKIFVN